MLNKEKHILTIQAKLRKEMNKLDPTTLPSRVSALEEAKHTHANKAALDEITSENVALLNNGILSNLTQEHISLLDRLSISEAGNLMIDGVEI